jgi:hypothetical protein
MGKNLEICLANAPNGAEQALREAAKVWDYAKFKFTFKANGCSSSGQFPLNNGVNQIDFGTLETADARAVTKPFTSGGNITECRHSIQQHAELAYQ